MLLAYLIRRQCKQLKIGLRWRTDYGNVRLMRENSRV